MDVEQFELGSMKIATSIHIPSCFITEDQEWYPQQKLHMAKLKLEGANPAYITVKELEAGFKNEKYRSKYLEAAKGVPSENVRARLPMENLSPEQQVGVTLKY